LRVVLQRCVGACLLLLSQVRPSLRILPPPRCLTCSLGLQGVLWTVGNSRGARKLTRTPHANQKIKNTCFLY
jgi:hypothetical protein